MSMEDLGSVVNEVLSTEFDAQGIHKTFGTELKSNPIVLKDSKNFKNVSATIDVPLPKNFNGRTAWKNYLVTPVRNQGKCGNCWAQASCNMLEDRFAIQSYGKILQDDQLSAVHLTICEYERDIDMTKELREDPSERESLRAVGQAHSACNGNSLYNAMSFLYRYGVPTRSCIDLDKYNQWCKTLPKPCTDIGGYQSDDDLPTCEDLIGVDYDECLDRKTAVRRYRAIAIYNVPADETAIMHEIYRWGTVACGFQTFPDFLSGYDGKSIYTHPDREVQPAGGHAVTIVGWGEEMQGGRLVKFWHIENSWSEKWGNGGFCRIERNLPGLELEQNVVAVIPDIPYIIIKCVPSSVKFLQASKDDEKRKAFGIDDMTGYRYGTIDKIRSGALKGDLTPLITVSAVPDFCNFTAGISLLQKDSYTKEELNRENNSITSYHAKNTMIIVLFILSIVGLIYSGRKLAKSR